MKNKILIVDDDIASVMLIKACFNHLGFEGEFFLAFDAESAISIAAKEKPDMITMDVQLTDDMDGITAAEIIKSRLDNAAIVFITSCSDIKTINSAVKIEPLAYLIKPIDINKLLTIYRNHFMLKKTFDDSEKLVLESFDCIETQKLVDRN